MRINFAAVASSLLAALNGAAAQCPPPIEKLAVDQKYDSARIEVGRLLKANPAADAVLACMGETSAGREVRRRRGLVWKRSIKVNERDPQHHLSLAGGGSAPRRRRRTSCDSRSSRERLKSELERAVALDPNLVDAHEGLRQY